MRGTIRPTETMRCIDPRAAIGPSVQNVSRSTPHGTTESRLRVRPIRVSSNTSSVQVAAIQVALRASSRSSFSRTGGLVSAGP